MTLIQKIPGLTGRGQIGRSLAAMRRGGGTRPNSRVLSDKNTQTFLSWIICRLFKKRIAVSSTIRVEPEGGLADRRTRRFRMEFRLGRLFI